MHKLSWKYYLPNPDNLVKVVDKFKSLFDHVESPIFLI